MAFKKIPSKYRKIVLAFWIIVATPIVISSLFVIAAATEILGDLPSFEELENPKSALATEVYSALECKVAFVLLK